MTRLALAILALIVMSDAAVAIPCLTKSQAMDRGDHPRYREVNGRRCWYVGRTPRKSEFTMVKPVKPAVNDQGKWRKPLSEEKDNEYQGQKALAATTQQVEAKARNQARRALIEDQSTIIQSRPAPEQARLERAFREIRVLWTTWNLSPWQVHALYGVLRLDYAERWPAWEMAARWL